MDDLIEDLNYIPEFANLLFIVDYYGSETAKSILCNSLPKSQKYTDAIDCMINLAKNKLDLYRDEIISQHIESLLDNTFDTNYLIQFIPLLKSTSVENIHKRIIMNILTSFDNKGVIYDINKTLNLSGCGYYFIVKKLTENLVLQINKIYQTVIKYDHLKDINFDNLEDLVMNSSLNEIIQISDKFDEISTHEDVEAFNEEVKLRLQDKMYPFFYKDVIYATHDKKMKISLDQPANKLLEILDKDEITLKYTKSYRRDREDSILCNTPEAPRLKISRDILNNLTCKELIEKIPKCWLNSSINKYYGLINLGYINLS